MKKLNNFSMACLLVVLFSISAQAQTLMPARQVSVRTNDWDYIAPLLPTVQSTLDWLDTQLDGLLVMDHTGWTNWLFVTGEVQDVFDYIDQQGPFLQGTNIAGATLVDGEWVFDLDISFDGLTDIIFIRTPSLAWDAQWPVDFYYNWDDTIGGVNTNWSTEIPSNRVAAVQHPAFITLSEVPGVLPEGGVYSYSFVDYSTYSNATQSFTVDVSLAHGTVIELHAWGGGSHSALGSGYAGGYAYGELTVVTNDFQATNATHVTNGTILAVQVGPMSGRAAVWRSGGSGFNSSTAELLAAGGAGGTCHDGGIWEWSDRTFMVFGALEGGVGSQRAKGGSPGQSGATLVDTGISMGGGVAATAGAGGAGGSVSGAAGTQPSPVSVAGTRIWGGVSSRNSDGVWFPGPAQGPAGKGGDGYYGGGSGGAAEWLNSSGLDRFRGGGGGGGSSYVAPSLQNGYTSLPVSPYTTPPNAGIGAYANNAGYAGYGARVAIVVKLGE